MYLQAQKVLEVQNLKGQIWHCSSDQLKGTVFILGSLWKVSEVTPWSFFWKVT